MLLRLTVALAVAGLGLLWAGAVRDSLGLVYLSILCTAIAGVGLIVYVRLSRRQATQLATGADAVAWRAQQEDAVVDTGRSGATGAAAAEPPQVPAPGPPGPPDSDHALAAGGDPGPGDEDAAPDQPPAPGESGSPPGTAPGEETSPDP